ncbi:MAG: RNB domain-containing ribonuclease [Bosea sp.]|uniref:RNB domain-containing ribonuclease n=1 Tax=Bosea sp. (in: a-proteobacteria) TaxID=1871050 RepID=UPI001ACAC34B|nr:RNB domain-containing ribonuclease [Bosea sp. (in: a-proteobacteria)]MBN9454351.1 RNB domain-containing ribonuclease [Bosea sp. (in: a-proteobacteria)]
MKTLIDTPHALVGGLAAIRRQFNVPERFPPAVLAAAESAAGRAPTAHVDRTGRPFVTLDPATSTDLDQAFAIERSGSDLLLHYAIADVAWFVEDGDAIDREAWQRGTTIYLPDGKAGLYPPILAEGAASLLPAVPRPAVIFTTRVDADGNVHLDGAERAVICSTAKLAYDSVSASELPPGFDELARRIEAAESRRGASRVDPPEQEVDALGNGRYQLLFRPRLRSEQQNATLSLASNIAIADALLAARTGLFRVMPEPDQQAVQRLRQTARALGLSWPDMETLVQFEKTLDPADSSHAAFMLAVRRTSGGASYVPYREGIVPWHAPMAATYAHATAPLRRLADRYVVRAALAVANGKPVPPAVSAAFEQLPAVMARADARDGQIDRNVIDLAEALMLQGSEGTIFEAVVTDADEHGLRMQLCELPVVARIRGPGGKPGDKIRVRLTSAIPLQHMVNFERVG